MRIERRMPGSERALPQTTSGNRGMAVGELLYPFTDWEDGRGGFLKKCAHITMANLLSFVFSSTAHKGFIINVFRVEGKGIIF